MDDADWLHQEFAKDIAQARAEERERCAKLADDYGEWTYWGQYKNLAAEMAAKEIAQAIRLGRPLTSDETAKIK